MYRIPKNFQLLAILFFCLNIPLAHGQIRPVIKGERPPIDISTIPADAWEPGIIKIKLTEQAAQNKSLKREAEHPQQISSLGLTSIDALNAKFGVKTIVETFYSPAFSLRNAEKHQAWGFDRWFSLHIDESADIPALIKEYSMLDEVAFAEPEYKKQLIHSISDEFAITESTENRSRTMNDPKLVQQWHYNNTGQHNGTPGADIDLFAAWEMETGNPDVIVAIYDEGVQHSHPDIAGNMWEGIGFNFVTNLNIIIPGNHGTHVAGTVAAVNNNDIGVAGVAGGSGTNDGVRIMSTQVFSGNSSGGFHLAPIYAADNGASILQSSWGYYAPGLYEQTVLDAIDYFKVNGGGEALFGGIAIFAAGNSGLEGAFYPACYSGSFAVAATTNKDQRAYYSNFGTWVDISAPGGEINYSEDRGILSTVTGNNYAFYQGTSMACPHVSGVAALAVSLTYGELNAIDLAEILRYTADDHYSLNPAYLGKLGSGRLNARKVLAEAQLILDGVRDPSTFSAEALSVDEVQLNWSLNQEANPIIIAYSESNEFGKPLSGTSYTAGDAIEGGGMVLYNGNQTSFLHTGLQQATDYYYKIWAYSDTLTYSLGRVASAKTLCEVLTLPFHEGFDAESELPICWTQEIEDGPSWEVGKGNGGYNPPNAFTGNNNIYFKTEGLFNSGLITRLVTPQLDMTKIDSAVLSFYYTNQMRVYLTHNWQDKLHIKYKAAIDDDWTLLESFESNIADWTEVSILLPNLSSDYYIAFEGVGYSGHGICIDEIEINGEQIDGFIITAGAEGNGTINPSGKIIVPDNEPMQFEIEANYGHHISDLLIDNESIAEAISLPEYTYNFQSVTSNHSIMAHFMPNAYTVTVEVLPAESGIVNIEGELFYGENIKLEAAPSSSDYIFSYWAVNGDSISAVNPFNFILESDTLLEAHFKSTTGISKSFVDQIVIYPNPAYNDLNIELPLDAYVQIFDLQGRLRYEANALAGKTSVDLSEFQQALYIIKMNFNDQIITKKLFRLSN